jgi:hypothetical protein
MQRANGPLQPIGLNNFDLRQNRQRFDLMGSLDSVNVGNQTRTLTLLGERIRAAKANGRAQARPLPFRPA